MRHSKEIQKGKCNELASWERLELRHEAWSCSDIDEREDPLRPLLREEQGFRPKLLADREEDHTLDSWYINAISSDRFLSNNHFGDVVNVAQKRAFI